MESEKGKIDRRTFLKTSGMGGAALVKSFTDSGYTLEQAKLKAVWKDTRIAAACVSMYSLNILKDNVAAAADGRQLSGREIEMMRRLAENTCDHYCTGCMKCASVMGSEGRIPDVMRYMMYYNGYGEKDEARRQFMALPETVRNNLALRDYSSVEPACPHKIEIGRAMKEAVRILG